MANDTRNRHLRAVTSNGMVLSAMALLLLAPLAIVAAQPTPYQQLGRDILRDLIETDTTHSTGDTTKAAEALARRFREAGFPKTDVVVIGPRSRLKLT